MEVAKYLEERTTEDGIVRRVSVSTDIPQKQLSDDDLTAMWEQSGRSLDALDVDGIRERIMTIRGSDETVDRDGDIIRVSGWELDNYRRNPVFLWAHNYSVPPVGSALAVTQSDGEHPSLDFTILFPKAEEYEFGATVHRLYSSGFMRASSVGFIPKTIVRVDDEDERQALGLGRYGYLITRQELLELSAVPVPANPSALMNGIKSGVITRQDVGALKVMTDLALWRADKCTTVQEFADGAEELRKALERLSDDLSGGDQEIDRVLSRLERIESRVVELSERLTRNAGGVSGDGGNEARAEALDDAHGQLREVYDGLFSLARRF